MKIIVFGAAGDVGSRLVGEAASRGHVTTAAVRSHAPPRLVAVASTIQKVDVLRTDSLVDLVKSHDVAISALRPPDGEEAQLVRLTEAVLDAASAARRRILVLGGAASLRVPDSDGHTVLTAPGFLPAEVVPIAQACQAQFEMLLRRAEPNWTYVAPPAELTPGERTGRYRVGADMLLVDDARRSRISMEDLAVAMIDEAETPAHEMTRFTAAY